MTKHHLVVEIGAKLPPSGKPIGNGILELQNCRALVLFFSKRLWQSCPLPSGFSLLKETKIYLVRYDIILLLIRLEPIFISQPPPIPRKDACTLHTHSNYYLLQLGAMHLTVKWIVEFLNEYKIRQLDFTAKTVKVEFDKTNFGNFKYLAQQGVEVKSGK